MGELSQVRDSSETTTPLSAWAGDCTVTDKDKYNGAMIGVTVPVGVGMIKASYARVKFKNDLGAVRSDLVRAGPRRFRQQARARLRA